MDQTTKASLTEELQALRAQVEPHFRRDTAAAGFQGTTPSTGHCAAVATIVYTELGGELVSATVEGVSHWFNRFAVAEGLFDVDLTADQFGRPAVDIAPASVLHPGTRVRAFEELRSETLLRAVKLAARAKFGRVVRTLREFLDANAVDS